jgi:dynein heavy chain 1
LLRKLIIRAGVKDIKLAFLFDESNALETTFLEHMNALLASGEVPGLFEGENMI